jgi:hypothetical protein
MTSTYIWLAAGSFFGMLTLGFAYLWWRYRDDDDDDDGDDRWEWRHPERGDDDWADDRPRRNSHER